MVKKILASKTISELSLLNLANSNKLSAYSARKGAPSACVAIPGLVNVPSVGVLVVWFQLIFICRNEGIKTVDEQLVV